MPLERFNGFGYRSRGQKSPYVWGCTDIYVPAPPTGGNTLLAAFSNRCGGASILKTLVQRNAIQLPSPAAQKF